MKYPITLCTSQWTDIKINELANKAQSWGLDGLELACGGDHFDVQKALNEIDYIPAKIKELKEHDLSCWAIANHLVGQCVSDPIDARHQAILPARIWGDGDPGGVNERAAQEMKDTATAAHQMGLDVVTGFTGSPAWSMIYPFPPTSQDLIQAAYGEFAERWLPILDHFQELGVRFALEIHPTEIAFDVHTMKRALEVLDFHPAFGINFDPSHLVPQLVDPVEVIRAFPERIFHVHVKDAKLNINGRNSILGSHLPFGDLNRGWDFVSPGRGDIDWDQIIRTLNSIGYQGPLSIEWEDSGMTREQGILEAIDMVKTNNFTPSDHAFDSVFGKEVGK